MRGLGISAFLALSAAASVHAASTTVNWYGVDGTHSFPSTSGYTAVPALNDPDDGLGAFDFVGDSSDPALSITSGAGYLFLRTRVDNAATVTSTASSVFNGTFIVMIDRVGWVNPYNGGTGHADYGFAWDNYTHKSLEMKEPEITGNTWTVEIMGDIDRNEANIVYPDFNTVGSTFVNKGDAFLRTIDQVSTANFGTTTYIEMAISWDYLKAHTTLDIGQDWKIQLGSISGANDYGYITSDIGGGAGIGSSVGYGWSEAVTMTVIPEPIALSALASVGLLGLVRPRRSHR